LQIVKTKNEKRKEEKKMKLRRLRKNVKAISPIISVLLMIAVAVVAALVTYAWVMGYIGFTTNKTGKAIQIQSIAFDGTTFNAYVQNVGDSQIKLLDGQCLYINGTLQTAANPSKSPLEQGETAAITPATTTLHHGDLVIVKVASADGTFSQVTQTLP
jgi:flagellin-like protein